MQSFHPSIAATFAAQLRARSEQRKADAHEQDRIDRYLRLIRLADLVSSAQREADCRARLDLALRTGR